MDLLYMMDKTKASSHVYHICPISLRNLGMEVSGGRAKRRSRDNAYDKKEEYTHLTKEEKVQLYDNLVSSIKENGFREETPLLIMLRRENNEDKLLEGHHRLNIAIELGLKTVPVRFIEWQKEYNVKGRWVNK